MAVDTEILKEKDFALYKQYSRIQKRTGVEEFERFKEKSAEVIDQIQNLKGDLYTVEGKNAQIRNEIDTLVDDSSTREQKDADTFNKSVDALKNKLKDDLNQVSYDSEKLRHLEASTKSKLALAASDKAVLDVLSDLVELSQRDKTTAYFTASYFYLFADKLEVVSDNKKAALVHVRSLVKKAEKHLYGELGSIKREIYSELANKRSSGTTSNRLIKMRAESLKRKYS